MQATYTCQMVKNILTRVEFPRFVSEQFSDWVGVGQNVARDIAPGAMGEFNVTKLVGHWFRQIRFWDPKGVEQFG